MENNIIIRAFKNKKIRSIFYLVLWFIFILWISKTFIMPLNNKNLNNTTDNTVNEMQDQEEVTDPFLKLKKACENLLKYNFKYVYKVNINNELILYKGTMFVNETSGYKESSEGIMRYYLNGKEIYQDILGERKLVTDKTTYVYNNLLSVDHIIELIQDKEYVLEENVYNFQIDDIYVKISLEVNDVAKIEITELNDSYVLEFSEVNLIESLQ